jgi:hypothetical protein
MKTIQFSAQIDEIKSRKDRTLLLKLNTQELQPEDTAQLFDLQNLQIWVALAETTVTRDDLNIPEVLVEKGEKPPSQRLRAVLYVYWEKRKATLGTFDSFYRQKVEDFIQLIKEKIE